MGKGSQATPARPYRPSPLLAAPGKRSRQEALPSALHMALSVAASLLVFAINNICVTELLGKGNYWTRLVQPGTMVRERGVGAAVAWRLCMRALQQRVTHGWVLR